MILTLYKNCILNDNYNEVFDLTLRKVDGVESSVFTDYLKTLSNMVINLPNVYYSRNMSFTLGISGNNKAKEAFEYNYCKIEAEGIVRYCFITDIELANSVATYYTEEDIWSNYAYDMQIRYGYLSQSYQLKYKINNVDKQINYYLPPVNYQSNDKIKFTKVQSMSDKFNIICQFQCYTVTEKGEVSKRLTRTVVFGYVRTESGVKKASASEYDITTIFKVLSLLQVNASNAQINAGDDVKPFIGEKYFYEIDNIIVLPKEWNISSFITNSSEQTITDCTIGTITVGTTISDVENITFLNISKLFNNLDFLGERILVEGALSNNFKVISFGTRTSQFEINMNGSSLDYSITAIADDANFKLYLNFQQKTIEITDNFILEIPIDIITADVNAQRRIAKNVEIYNGVSNIVSGTAKTTLNVASIASGNVSAVTTRAQKINYGKYGQVTSSKHRSETSYNPIGSGSYSGVIGGLTQIADGIVGIMVAKAPIYTSNTGTFAKSEAMINATFGLCYIEITPDNEEFINSLIKLIGFNVYEIVNDNIFFKQDFKNFNICKFESIDIYGNFPQSIKKDIEAILINGFKIWYNSELKEKIENADIQ